MVLVPAITTLLGKGSWWFPAWLGRVAPEVDIEGSMISPAGGEAG
jgi:RND superfamily putative drug exporter